MAGYIFLHIRQEKLSYPFWMLHTCGCSLIVVANVDVPFNFLYWKIHALVFHHSQSNHDSTVPNSHVLTYFPPHLLQVVAVL